MSMNYSRARVERSEGLGVGIRGLLVSVEKPVQDMQYFGVLLQC